jgi:MSHA pilin protein MshA
MSCYFLSKEDFVVEQQRYESTFIHAGVNDMHKRQMGFTLIELVIVIVILGLLAATALPRFINISQQACIASVQGMAGGLRSSASLAKAEWLVNGSTAGNFINMDGIQVLINSSGYPASTTNGIENAIQDTAGFTVTHPADSVFEPSSCGGTNCRATYDADFGTVAVLSTGCTT